MNEWVGCKMSSKIGMIQSNTKRLHSYWLISEQISREKLQN